MKKIRRWLLLFAVIIALMVRVDGLKATSLIFGRAPATSSTTTTTTTTVAPSSTTEESAEEDEQAVEQGDDNVTKAPLTGIPQVDYVWDPNLPRELRGYNLSNYPFLDSVPVEEDIGFTCDPKLHDGFYASIKYNCQLYHHCINGIRYDFLCANYTAFDQKTFICHFASEVDCKNSPKYWFRNEHLYKATTTTTVKPPPTTSTTPAPTAAPTRPKPLRKPVRRRRPEIDYYYYYDDDEDEDELYEERNRRRKNRPRNRRPIYDDFEEDDRLERRPVDRYRERDRDRDEDEDDYDDRRPYRTKTRTRNGDRRPVMDDDRRYYDDRRRDRDRRPAADDRRRPLDDDRRGALEDEKRPSQNDRRYSAASDRRNPAESRRPVANDERRPGDRRLVNDDRRSFSSDDRRASVDDRKSAKRPAYNDDRRSDYDDEEDDGYGARRQSEKRRRPGQDAPKQNDVVTVKPSGSSIYDRPRAAPRINRPVPLNEKNKYAYANGGNAEASKSKKPPAPAVADPEPEYYDDYEDDTRRETNVDKRKAVESGEQQRLSGSYSDGKRPSASSDVVYYDDVIIAKDTLPQKPVPGNVRKPEGTERVNSRDNSELANRYNEKVRAPLRNPKPDEYQDEYEPTVSKTQPAPKPAANIYSNYRGKKQPAAAEVTTRAPPHPDHDYEEANKPLEVPRPIMRSTKRPFLPSRGGNPYLARGLQPVGVAKQPLGKPAAEPAEKPAPFRIDLDSVGPAPSPPRRPVAPAQPQPVNAKTLDQLYDDDFDVTLNDALNPTLKPLTRSAPQNFFRNRYVHQSDAEFVPFEPSYAPSEYRRMAVRPPPSVILYHPASPGAAVSQRHDYAGYEY